MASTAALVAPTDQLVVVYLVLVWPALVSCCWIYIYIYICSCLSLAAWWLGWIKWASATAATIRRRSKSLSSLCSHHHHLHCRRCCRYKPMKMELEKLVMTRSAFAHSLGPFSFSSISATRPNLDHLQHNPYNRCLPKRLIDNNNKYVSFTRSLSVFI